MVLHVCITTKVDITELALELQARLLARSTDASCCFEHVFTVITDWLHFLCDECFWNCSFGITWFSPIHTSDCILPTMEVSRLAIPGNCAHYSLKIRDTCTL